MGDHTFGVLICYEDSDPFLGRRLAQDNADGKSVDFLVNISNDGWFDGTSEHEEHLVVSKFRAIEARRSMVRAVNMGVSAVIDGNGRILKPHALPAPVYDPNRLGMKLIRYLQKYQLWEVPALGPVEELPVAEYADFKKTAGVLLATVPIDSRASVYAAWGDWLPISGWVLVGLCSYFPGVGCGRRPNRYNSRDGFRVGRIPVEDTIRVLLGSFLAASVSGAEAARPRIFGVSLRARVP